MARFERVNLAPAEWGRTLSTFPDAIVYQSPAWLSFLAETQKGEPVLAVLKEGDQTLGYFSGLVVRRLGLKILGSPFRAWTLYGAQPAAHRPEACGRCGPAGIRLPRVKMPSF
jgi:hypothetical protein